MQSSVIRELLKLTVQPGVISFAGGLPAPEFFPVREFEEACRFVLRHQGQITLQHSPAEGCAALKEWQAVAMSEYGIWVEPENILMISGSQQGLDLIGKLFIDVGSYIATRDLPEKAVAAKVAYVPGFASIRVKREENTPCGSTSPARTRR